MNQNSCVAKNLTVFIFVLGLNVGALMTYIFATTSLQFQVAQMSEQQNGTKLLNLTNYFVENKTAAMLFENIRVVCWILTYPENHDKKAIHVKATWGKRCNKLVFMSSQNNDTLPSVDLGVLESRKTLWGKTKAAFKYIWDNYRDEGDWFLKADDDTYVIMDNLRYMLSQYNSSDPLYFGCKLRKFVKSGYMSGGAGYILSKESVQRLVNVGLNDTTGKYCRKDEHGPEDVEIGKCMENLNVTAADSRDFKGQGRFFPVSPGIMLFKGAFKSDYWLYKYAMYPFETGMSCCSQLAVTFHYVTPRDMYVFDYLIYHLKLYGWQSDLFFKQNSDLNRPTFNKTVLKNK